MFEAVPKELRELQQWVCAKRDSKCPWMATQLSPASTSNPSTWSSIESAVASVQSGFYDNIGFVFADNGIVGIDIDLGYDDDGFLTLMAADVLNACQSYTEKSRSGRGFHILLRGKLPYKGKNNQKGLEIYQSGRYFIMTGEQILFDTIRESQEAIDYIVEKYFQDSDRKVSGDRRISDRVYHPEWKLQGRRIPMRPHYPPITVGGRNLSLTSLAGVLRNAGYNRKQIYTELLKCNKAACNPTLCNEQIRQIVNSVMRYQT